MAPVLIDSDFLQTRRTSFSKPLNQVFPGGKVVHGGEEYKIISSIDWKTSKELFEILDELTGYRCWVPSQEIN